MLANLFNLLLTRTFLYIKSCSYANRTNMSSNYGLMKRYLHAKIKMTINKNLTEYGPI